MALTTLRALLVALLTACLLPAQGPYYVNGLTGADAPGYGSSAAQPYKTIGYALANVPPQSPSSGEIIYVEGDQRYSPSTNGETFPIAPAFNVWIEGTYQSHGNWPILDIPAGSTGFHFPGNVNFSRNAVTFRYLVLENGDYGMRMGGDPGARHRPRVQDCIFRDQAVAAVSIINNNGTADDPRFFQNVFDGTGASIGIEARAPFAGRPVPIDVEDSEFFGFATAIALGGGGASQGDLGTVTALLHLLDIHDCDAAVSTWSEEPGVLVSVDLRNSRIASCDSGVRMRNGSIPAASAPDTQELEVRDSAFLSCPKGIDVLADPGSATDFSVAVSNSTFEACGTGVDYYGHHRGSNSVELTDTVLRQCGDGVDVRHDHNLSGVTVSLLRCKVLDCMYGVDARIPSVGASLTLDDTIVAGSGSYGVRFYGYSGSLFAPTWIAIGSSTIADCDVGVSVAGSGGGAIAGAVTASAFGGNNQDIVAGTGLTVDDSCLQSSSWPGNNLNNTDPQLYRPFYKLAPGSPCIDALSSATATTTDYEGDVRPSIGTSGGSALFDIGADEYVYAGTARPYGTGGFGPFHVLPRISSPNTSVTMGGAVQVDLTQAIMPRYLRPALFAALSFGFLDDSGALPFDLAPWGMSGCFLHNEGLLAFPLQAVSSTGTASITYTLPNYPALVGSVFTHQWFAMMPSRYGVVSSDGLRVTLGQ